MPDARIPGSLGGSNQSEVDVEDGTGPRRAAPRSSPIGSAPRSASRSLSAVAAEFRRTSEWGRLQRTSVQFLGPESFSLGVAWGIGEATIRDAASLVQLILVFVLADLHDRAERPSLWRIRDPFDPAKTLLAIVVRRTFGGALKEAHNERQAFINELREAVGNPGNMLEGIKAEYATKWRRFEELVVESSLAAQFEAGKIVGEVLLDVLSLIGGGTAAVKAASKVPRLARLATTMQGKLPKMLKGAAVRPAAGITTSAGGASKGAAAATPAPKPVFTGKPATPAEPAMKTAFKTAAAARHSGMTKAAAKATQKAAQKHRVNIEMRPTNPYSTPLRQQGHPPKPGWLKMKTINDEDVLLGADPKTRGMVGYFDPKKPSPAGLTDAEYAKALRRYEQRKSEFKKYDEDIAKETRVQVKDGVVIDKKTGKAFAGDYDVYRITDANGTPLHPESKRYRDVMRDLKQDPVGAQHDAHVDWKPKSQDEAMMKDDIIQKHQTDEPLSIFKADGSISTGFAN